MPSAVFSTSPARARVIPLAPPSVTNGVVAVDAVPPVGGGSGTGVQPLTKGSSIRQMTRFNVLLFSGLYPTTRTPLPAAPSLHPFFRFLTQQLLDTSAIGCKTQQYLFADHNIAPNRRFPQSRSASLIVTSSSLATRFASVARPGSRAACPGSHR